MPINQNPTSSPNPVGPQAPEKSPADARREAIQRAFDRANKTRNQRRRPKAAPVKAAEARPGHNNPPEETPKLDLKRRPDDQPQPRDRGRFAPRGSRRKSCANWAAKMRRTRKRATAPRAAALPANAPYAAPPGRFAERAKAEWAHAPESVRGEVHRMQEEFVKAYRVYKGDFER